MDVFQLGAAVKPSALGENKLQKLVKLAETLSKLGYDYLVIDSEKAKDDIPVSSYCELLTYCQNRSLCLPVLTIPVRRGDYPERFSEFLEVVSRKSFGGVCLVAGNQAYLNDEEKNAPAGRHMLEAVEKLRIKAYNCLVMVGTENMVRTAYKAITMYRAIPLALLGPKIFEEISSYPENGVCKGIYTPFYVGEPINKDVSDRLYAYVSRRKTGIGINDAFEFFSLTGKPAKIIERLTAMNRYGARLVVGYPLMLTDEQLALFASLLKV